VFNYLSAGELFEVSMMHMWKVGQAPT
jgi:hypothetical protein